MHARGKDEVFHNHNHPAHFFFLVCVREGVRVCVRVRVRVCVRERDAVLVFVLDDDIVPVRDRELVAEGVPDFVCVAVRDGVRVDVLDGVGGGEGATVEDTEEEEDPVPVLETEAAGVLVGELDSVGVLV